MLYMSDVENNISTMTLKNILQKIELFNYLYYIKFANVDKQQSTQFARMFFDILKHIILNGRG